VDDPKQDLGDSDDETAGHERERTRETHKKAVLTGPRPI